MSPYDDEIKAAAEIIGWDWRLLASLVYQESEFKPNVRSWVGAYGLMQLMPNVLEKYGLDSNASPSEQLNAGVKHLIFIKKQIPTEITDTVEQVKFLLASYNCGLGHVLDARRLAVKHEKDPNNWTTNVDSCDREENSARNRPRWKPLPPTPGGSRWWLLVTRYMYYNISYDKD